MDGIMNLHSSKDLHININRVNSTIHLKSLNNFGDICLGLDFTAASLENR